MNTKKTVTAILLAIAMTLPAQAAMNATVNTDAGGPN